MVRVRDIVIRLKKVKEEKGLSYNDIIALMDKNGDYISKSTLSRVFADGSEDKGFRYEITIRPIARALLDIENIEEDDSMDVQAMKSLLKYKIQRMEELERQVEKLETELDKEKIRYHEKLDKEREQFNQRIDFLKNQIELKDKRMDMLLNTTLNRENQYNDIMNAVMSCPLRKKDED